MFDSVKAQCPVCQEYGLEFQSKAGDCTLAEYRLDNCPPKIAADVIGNTTSCSNCGRPATLQGQVLLTLD